MSILDGDIKLLQSERLTDNPDGGGRITGHEIVDGESNNLFPDVSDLDRVYGRVALRKGFTGVHTDNTDVYYGAHLIVLDPPDDPNVAVSLFTRNDANDERRDARDRVESYVVIGPMSRYRLLGDQLEGQRSLTVFTADDAPTPEVGDVLALSTERGSDAGRIQYVRITAVASETRTFVDQHGEFDRQVITLDIGNPLTARFFGMDASRYTDVRPDSLVRETVVADAATYYGTREVTEAAALGDITVRLDSIFNPIVPSAQAESPVTDVPASGDQQVIVAAGDPRTVTVDFGAGTDTRYLAGPITPGSLTIGAVTDNAGGELLRDGQPAGTVDYASGAILPTAAANLSGSQSVTYTPAAAVQAQTFTQQAEVTLATRAYNYVANLQPIPAPGTLLVDYRAQGRWYRLRDNGLGELVGDVAGTGTGQVSFQTGSVTVTLGALPDVDTAILFSWGMAERYESRAATLDVDYRISHDFETTIRPGTLQISWESGGQTRSATTAYYVLTGAATGRVSPSGRLSMTPEYLPSAGALFSASFNSDTAESESASVGNPFSWVVANGPILPGSLDISIVSAAVELEFVDSRYGTPTRTYRIGERVTLKIRDDGAGNLTGDIGAGGTVDYASGQIDFDPATVKRVLNTRLWATHPFDFPSADGRYRDGTATYRAGDSAVVRYIKDSGSGTADSVKFAAPPLTVDLAQGTQQQIVATGVLFQFAGEIYADRAGKLYKNIDPATGAGTEAGSIDYATGIATINDYADGDSGLEILALLVQFQAGTVSQAQLRTPGAPLRPGSFFIRANKRDGTLISATANTNGDIDENGITGTVSYDTGVAAVEFAEPVLPNTIFYNAVIYSFLPLDPDILGLSPVRLPQDGRVPIYRPGDVAVVHNTQVKQFPSGAAALDTLDCGRTRLAHVEVRDAKNKKVDADMWSADLDTGIVTLTAAYDDSGYTTPIEARHRIEDMAVVTDVQVSGYVTLMNALSHDYPKDDTYCSSALIAGDLQARVANVFDQRTWTQEWSDELIGDDTDAEYNATQYPIAVTNRGAITERWSLVFTGSTAFKVIGEHVGQIALGDTTTECKPTNPATSVPYFTLDPLGWGAGWSAGNVLRFNTVGATFPVWIARTVLQGPATVESDEFRIQIRGNANR